MASRTRGLAWTLAIERMWSEPTMSCWYASHTSGNVANHGLGGGVAVGEVSAVVVDLTEDVDS